MSTAPGTALDDPDWWRHAVVYQIYPRSFRDADGDGNGDIRGMRNGLGHLARLGVDAVWVSPWYTSPMIDGGYDVADYCDIDPIFGSLDDATVFLDEAHRLGLRVLVDLVPNHCSDRHPLFQRALAAAPGSPERDLFVFRDGRGVDGGQPPTNWGSLFGGSMWQQVTESDGRPGQWYCHMFAPEQPDWNWDNPQVVAFFDQVLRFWFDRGVDGFRIDVADSMALDQTLPDTKPDPATGFGSWHKDVGAPFWDQPGVETIHRRWRQIADSYADTALGARVFVSEAHLDPIERQASYVGAGRLHTTFNPDHLWCEWTAASQRHMITRTLAAHDAVGAPATWVIGNHDVPRPVTRYGKPETGWPFDADGRVGQPRFAEDHRQFPTDVDLGRRRARAAALLMFALPGVAYLYQGEELGLPEVEDLPAEVLQDPIWDRSGHTEKGRDGCRVPLPWSGTKPPYGFGPGPGEPWLPQPAGWAGLSVAAQTGVTGSHLELYRAALAIRHANPALRDGRLAWDEASEQLLSFCRGDRFRCLVNFGPGPAPLPAGTVLLASGDVSDTIPGDTAVWLAT